MSAASDGAAATESDVLVIGAGPAGATAAILLAQRGWRVAMVEQHSYPRQKVCGGCISAGSFSLLDELGVGSETRRRAGAELRRLGWMRADTEVVADMPACAEFADCFGRALGRDVLDELLLKRAAAVGVRIFQPAKVRKVSGRPGRFACEVESTRRSESQKTMQKSITHRASLIVDAHGSWESAPRVEAFAERCRPQKAAPRAADLFAFKAAFAGATLAPGLLPVVALAGGYGGMVVGNNGLTTVALCLRRDKLQALRVRSPGVSAALAVDAHLRKACRGIRDALREAQRQGPWLSVGPLQPGVRLQQAAGLFRVGNACGESHPLIGEGISMALQSSKLLVDLLVSQPQVLSDARSLRAIHDAYQKQWQSAFLPRLRIASVYAHIAMRTPLAAAAGRCLRQWPAALTTAARLAGKARPAPGPCGF